MVVSTCKHISHPLVLPLEDCRVPFQIEMAALRPAEITVKRKLES